MRKIKRKKKLRKRLSSKKPKRRKLRTHRNTVMRLNQMLKSILKSLMKTLKLVKEELERSKSKRAALTLINQLGWLNHQTNANISVRPQFLKELLLV